MVLRKKLLLQVLKCSATQRASTAGHGTCALAAIIASRDHKIRTLGSPHYADSRQAVY